MPERDATSDPSLHPSRVRGRILELPKVGQLLLKPLRPGDAGMLRAGFARLSARSRYLRFAQALTRLTDDQVTYLTALDGRNRAAWCASDLTLRPRLGVGVARYVRLDTEPEAAEVAITIVDSHQGRGIARALLATLAETALLNGIRRFRGVTLAENHQALSLARKLGAQIGAARRGLVELELDLTKRPLRL